MRVVKGGWALQREITRSRSVHGATSRRGTCPVCRRGNLRLRVTDGKVGVHGKTAANPRGCPGYGGPPMPRAKGDGTPAPDGGAIVVGFRPDQPPEQDGCGLPALDEDGDPVVEVPVERREPDLGLRIRSARSPDLDDAS